MVALVVVQHLQEERAQRGPKWASAKHPRAPKRLLTWATLRTAIFRTMGGARVPNEAGTDFWTLPKVMAPYLEVGKAVRPGR